MFSEKSFQAWRAQRGAIEERERARIRADVEAEVDAAIVHGRLAREAEEARGQLARSMRHATAARRMRELAPALTPEQRVARLAEIRRGVEADVAEWDRERQARQAPPAQPVQTRAAPAGTPPAAPTQRPPKVGDVRSYGSYGRYRWDGARWAYVGPAAA